MCIAGILANTFGIVSTFSIELPFLCKLISVISEVLMLVLTFIAFYYHKTSVISVIMTVLIGNVVFPVMFVTEGGLNGGIAFYFMLPSICIAFSIRRPLNILIVFLSLVEYSILIYISYNYPSFIIPIPKDAILSDVISGCICVFLFLFIFTTQYAIQCKRDRQRIDKLSQMYCHQANTDELTELFNRRYFKELFLKHLSDNEENNLDDSRIFLAMFDIDNFKKINDTYGHPFGDKVLKQFAEILFEESSNGSISCRYGGEEFLIMIKGLSFNYAYAKVESILNKTRTRISCGTEKKPVTVSAGFVFCEKNSDYAEILKSVDEKLYEAKKTGKNRIVS